ncbi:cordon-bleu protein-like 1b isoform X2 [Hypomesus transpacificus]|uniref:cordon-bleu protein-like 1b isoform X2 n=1 Tax=Hypomesus transpacificus TaxID=137520 RepID=UPI001F085387|nr:cordon-bleu protein-like 1b isoform X2 [Hypomesus transpacificus]
MKVDNKPVGQRHSCPGNFVNPVQLDMDQHGTHSTPHRRLSGIRVSTKSKAPSPPPALKGLGDQGRPQRYPGFPHRTMDQKENLLEREMNLLVVLPGGAEKTTLVHGSKPMMDLLVMLCAKYHLNPSGHTIELVTTNRNHIKFKPNAPIGTLEAEKILLKPKGGEDKNKKSCPQMPEATVRLVINYKKTQKTILRVNPRVPLQELLPAICEKCEFAVDTTVLLRDLLSPGPLDLTTSLHDCGVRELYAKDIKGPGPADRSSSPVCPASPSHHSTADTITPGKDKKEKEKENKGMFSLFRRSRKKPEQSMPASAPASPVRSKPRPLSMASLGAPYSFYDSSTMPADVPKKRRAPLPPMLVSQSCPSDLSSRPRISSEAEVQSDPDQTTSLSPGSYSESSLRRTKRKAPPPPASPSSSSTAGQDDAPPGGSLTGGPVAMTLEEIAEQEEASVGLDSGDIQEEDSSLDLSADVSMELDVAGDASPAPGAPPPGAAPPGGPPPGATGEDQPCDLSSDGKPTQVDGEDADARLRTEMSFTEVVDTDRSSCQVEVPREQTDLSSRNSTSQDGSKEEVSAPTALEVVQEAGSQASCRPDSDPPGEESVLLGPLTTSTPCPPGEDATVQTDAAPPSSPSAAPQQEVPSPAEPSSSEPAGQKRDMATSTEEMRLSEPHPASTQASEPHPASTQASEAHPASTQASEAHPASTQASEAQPASTQALEAHPASTQASEAQPASTQASEAHPASTQASEAPPCLTPAPSAPTAAAAAKAAPFYATDSEPKPKPSNELTRDYIPKVGMTTYTIVPQKSLEKLRFFEVELTLESRPDDPEEEAEVGSLKLDDCAAPREQVQVATEPTAVQSTTPRGASAQTGNTTGSDITVNSSMTEVNAASTPPSKLARDDKISFSTDGGVASIQAALIAKVKEMKIAPATKPKPGSFRLPQHKATPGGYVTSAAVKSGGASPGAGQREAPASVERERPRLAVAEGRLPPPPVLCQESPGGARAQPGPEEEVEGGERRSVPSALLTRQTSSTAREPLAGLSLEKFRTFAAPRPYSPSTPSRFAQAVSSAVRRTQSVSHSPTATSPRSPPFHPVSGRFSIKDPKRLAHSKGADNRPEGEDKGSQREGGAKEAACGSASDMTAHTTAPSQPEQSSSACGEDRRSNGANDTYTGDVVLP